MQTCIRILVLALSLHSIGCTLLVGGVNSSLHSSTGTRATEPRNEFFEARGENPIVIRSTSTPSSSQAMVLSARSNVVEKMTTGEVEVAGTNGGATSHAKTSDFARSSQDTQVESADRDLRTARMDSRRQRDLRFAQAQKQATEQLQQRQSQQRQSQLVARPTNVVQIAYEKTIPSAEGLQYVDFSLESELLRRRDRAIKQVPVIEDDQQKQPHAEATTDKIEPSLPQSGTSSSLVLVSVVALVITGASLPLTRFRRFPLSIRWLVTPSDAKALQKSESSSLDANQRDLPVLLQAESIEATSNNCVMLCINQWSPEQCLQADTVLMDLPAIPTCEPKAPQQTETVDSQVELEPTTKTQTQSLCYRKSKLARQQSTALILWKQPVVVPCSDPSSAARSGASESANPHLQPPRRLLVSQSYHLGSTSKASRQVALVRLIDKKSQMTQLSSIIGYVVLYRNNASSGTSRQVMMVQSYQLKENELTARIVSLA